MHTQLDTRAEARRRRRPWRRAPSRTVVTFVLCAGAAALLAFVPEHAGLGPAGRRAFFVLLVGAGLWVTEAIPSYAVALLVIALEIALLGRPGGAFAEAPDDYERFLAPFGSPVIWLFFGGFVLAKGAARTGVDVRMAAFLLGRYGSRPGAALAIVMGVTFVFSMFISNTAATAAMIALLAPLAASLDRDDPFARGLLLGVPFAANLGGMGTVIGSPPNAIAVGALAPTQPVGFAAWMLAGVPPSVVLALLVYVLLRWRYRPAKDRLDIGALEQAARKIPMRHPWHRELVVGVFGLTVLLWMTSPLHGLPTTVVSFVPIVAFTVGGVLRSAEIRELPWEVLLLLAGGLSLGVAVKDTGLAAWLVERLPTGALGPLGMALLLAYVTAVLSNFMSNTAATNILVPIGLALAGGGAGAVLPIALSASCAMALPVSTPPNAIAQASGRLHSRDFLLVGLAVGVLGPLLVTLWTRVVSG